MKRNVLVISVVFVLLVSACGSQATPTVNPADIQSTSQAAALTIVAQTQQALPTLTPVPPTETPSLTPPPTQPSPALPTASTQGAGTQGAVSTGVVLPTGMPTFTPQSSSGSSNNQDPCNQPLVSWQGPTVNFTISNQTKPKGTIVLSMYVVTEMGQCGYLIITGDSFTGPVGQYSAGAFITGKKNMKSFGSFKINGGNWKVVVKNDNITASGSCYPNC
ncbi:MAG: hypothetical protein EHM40_00780 [Chloroflexi bacterium]|nr:MAG: hypothetical protein EHM40_00780 [Chloroflexota bacterium]